MANHYKVGDVVQLMSGGPKMTVDAVEGDQAWCVWFDGNQEKRGVYKIAPLD
ncbi:MAG: DUF2158 domain-containing protein [Candidatus Angelobacter sp.]